jgi:hypothetical protein
MQYAMNQKEGFVEKNRGEESELLPREHAGTLGLPDT